MKISISDITIVNLRSTVKYNVGDNIYDDNNVCMRIAKIIDKSIKVENQYVSIFSIQDENGTTLKTIINCPVEVSYLRRI